MRNKIVYCDELPEELAGGHIATINGEEIKTIESFIFKMYVQLCFPVTSGFTEDNFIEGMTNLTWLENIQNIYIVIKDFDHIFGGRKEKQAVVLTWFNDIILPYWDKKFESNDTDPNLKILHVYCTAEEPKRILH